jgi:glucokinase
MSLIGIDLGGTKLAVALFSNDGNLLRKKFIPLEKRKGNEVGKLIAESYSEVAVNAGPEMIRSIGISVPGIYHHNKRSVWAPNIPGWDDYPLYDEMKKVTGDIPLAIDSDRACYILGEAWQGNAKGCTDAIFLAVGTGIGAGILAGGNILRGAYDIAGAIGWMALSPGFRKEYVECGCFEYYASGSGITKNVIALLGEMHEYTGELRALSKDKITSHDVFIAYNNNDPLAKKIIDADIQYWGMASANLVSLFNPQKVLFGGGVFGPAVQLIPLIKKEAEKWAQPISIQQASFESAALKNDAGLYGAAFLALKRIA